MPRINLLEEQARELAGMPEAWQLYHYQVLGPPGPGFIAFMLEGSIPPPFKSGPRKGRPNWKAADPSTKRTVYITPAQQDAWLAAWEEKTGLCRHCTGAGEICWSSSVTEGSKYRPCRECGGAGKAKPQEREVA